MAQKDSDIGPSGERNQKKETETQAEPTKSDELSTIQVRACDKDSCEQETYSVDRSWFSLVTNVLGFATEKAGEIIKNPLAIGTLGTAVSGVYNIQFEQRVLAKNLFVFQRSVITFTDHLIYLQEWVDRTKVPLCTLKWAYDVERQIIEFLDEHFSSTSSPTEEETTKPKLSLLQKSKKTLERLKNFAYSAAKVGSRYADWSLGGTIYLQQRLNNFGSTMTLALIATNSEKMDKEDMLNQLQKNPKEIGLKSKLEEPCWGKKPKSSALSSSLSSSSSTLNSSSSKVSLSSQMEPEQKWQKGQKGHSSFQEKTKSLSTSKPISKAKFKTKIATPVSPVSPTRSVRSLSSPGKGKDFHQIYF